VSVVRTPFLKLPEGMVLTAAILNLRYHCTIFEEDDEVVVDEGQKKPESKRKGPAMTISLLMTDHGDGGDDGEPDPTSGNRGPQGGSARASSSARVTTQMTTRSSGGAAMHSPSVRDMRSAPTETSARMSTSRSNPEDTARSNPERGPDPGTKIVLFKLEKLPATPWPHSKLLEKGYSRGPPIHLMPLDLNTDMKFKLEISFQNNQGFLHVPSDFGLRLYYTPKLPATPVVSEAGSSDFGSEKSDPTMKEKK
jgi:hypothetical protein